MDYWVGYCWWFHVFSCQLNHFCLNFSNVWRLRWVSKVGVFNFEYSDHSGHHLRLVVPLRDRWSSFWHKGWAEGEAGRFWSLWLVEIRFNTNMKNPWSTIVASLWDGHLLSLFTYKYHPFREEECYLSLFSYLPTSFLGHLYKSLFCTLLQIQNH